MQLVPMTAHNLKCYLESRLPAFASDRAIADGVSLQQAEREVREQIRTILPDGVGTEEHHLFHIVTEDSKEKVGSIWLHATSLTKCAYLHDIVIDEQHRRRGYAFAAMVLIEGKARDLGCEQLSLNVFAHNGIADALYKKLGYETKAMRMRKCIRVTT